MAWDGGFQPVASRGRPICTNGNSGRKGESKQIHATRMMAKKG